MASRFAAIADACLPAACVVCSGEDRSGLCEACLGSLPGRFVARCARCATAIAASTARAAAPGEAGTDMPAAELRDRICADCAATPPAFARTIVFADYAPPLDRVVHALKFGRDASIAAPLGHRLVECAQRFVSSSEVGDRPHRIVTAIPLTTRRLAERGFNQSLEIARAFARRASIELDARALVRVRDTAPASTLHAEERREALQDAFEATRALDGALMIVIDDVMTTGATLEAAAKVLLRAGASIVINCVVARTPAAENPRRDDPRRPRPA